MDYKPADVFVGVVEFFSILLPGAFLTFMIAHLAATWLLSIFPELSNSNTAWAAFIFASYFLGHVVYGLAAQPLNILYGKTYRRWPGAAADALETNAKSIAVALVTLRGEGKAGQKPGESAISSEANFAYKDAVLSLATAIVRNRAAAGVTEIDRSEADSKFFRSIAGVLLLTAIGFSFVPTSPLFTLLQKGEVIGGSLVLLLLSLWRFMDLRHRLVTLTYELFIAITKGPESPN